MAAKIKKGDRVVVIAGRDKGKAGEVLEVRPAEGRAVVRGIALIKRHQRQTPAPAIARQAVRGNQPLHSRHRDLHQIEPDE